MRLSAFKALGFRRLISSYTVITPLSGLPAMLVSIACVAATLGSAYWSIIGSLQENAYTHTVPANPAIAGRIVGIRQRGTDEDIMHLNIYLPPYTAKNATHITKLLCDDITKLVQSLPKRCIPIL